MDSGSVSEPASLRSRMLLGAAIFGITPLLRLLLGGSASHVSVGSLILVAALFAGLGALAGAVHFAADSWRGRGGVFTTIANVAPVLTVGLLGLAVLGLLAWLDT